MPRKQIVTLDNFVYEETVEAPEEPWMQERRDRIVEYLCPSRIEDRDWANASLEDIGRWHDEDVPLEPWYVDYDYSSEAPEWRSITYTGFSDVESEGDEADEEDLIYEWNGYDTWAEHFAKLPKIDRGYEDDIIVE